MTIKDIFKAYAPEYIQRFGAAIPGEHRKVIDAILNCRSEYYGASIYFLSTVSAIVVCWHFFFNKFRYYLY